MRITNLPASSSFAPNDVLAIEINGRTYKLTGATLAAAIESIGDFVTQNDIVTTTADGLMLSTDKVKLDGIAAGAQVNTLTGVKGNAESSYRTGNVNLTPANLGAAPYINLVNLTTWAAIYNALSVLANQNVANVFVGPDSAALLTNNIVDAVLTGTVSASNKTSGNFDFIVAEANGKKAYNWRVSGLSSASATPTVGTVYSYINGAVPFINLSNLSTWAEIYNALSILGNQDIANVFIINASTLTNGKTAAVMQGTVSCSNITNGSFDFFCSGVSTQNMYQWRVTNLKSASSTPSVGSVYRFTGTAM